MFLISLSHLILINSFLELCAVDFMFPSSPFGAWLPTALTNQCTMTATATTYHAHREPIQAPTAPILATQPHPGIRSPQPKGSRGTFQKSIFSSIPHICQKLSMPQTFPEIIAPAYNLMYCFSFPFSISSSSIASCSFVLLISCSQVRLLLPGCPLPSPINAQ